MTEDNFEKFGAAWDRQLLSSRMKIRRFEENEKEDILVKYSLNLAEQSICNLRDANEKSIRQRTWKPLINALAQLGITFPTTKKGEEFIKQIALERLREEE